MKITEPSQAKPLAEKIFKAFASEFGREIKSDDLMIALLATEMVARTLREMTFERGIAIEFLDLNEIDEANIQ